MTIPTTASKVTQQGNGATTVWPYAFEIPGSTPTDQTNVKVTLYDTTVNPAVTTVLPNNAYSITGISTASSPNNTGGNVTYPLTGTPIAAGVSITIARNVPNVQNTDIPNQSAFYGTVLTSAYDYAMMCIQQLATLLTYTLNFPITDTTPPATLPGASARANTLLGFDGAGQPALYGQTAPAGTVLNFNSRTVSGDTTCTTADCYIRADASSAALTVTLPAVATMSGRAMVIKKIDATNNIVTISGDANIDALSKAVLTHAKQSIMIYSNGVVWDIL